MKKIRFNFKTVATIVLCFAAAVMLSSSCVDDLMKLEDNDIISFTFTNPPANGDINYPAKTVTVVVPDGTDRTKLVPVINVSTKASINPPSELVQDFTSPVNYKVTAENGNVAMWTVTVIVSNTPLSGEKKITAFSFATPSAVGTINESAKTIAVKMPDGTNLTSLTPTIAVSAKATVDPASGVAKNFTNPVLYTVTAEDGTTAQYTVTVSSDQPNGTPVTLQGYIKENRTLKDLGFAIDYIVPNWVEFNNNAIITIEPGVCIAFETTSGNLTVTGGATIKMLGTAAQPIQFRGTGATYGTEKGSWNYISINTNSDNIMQYVECLNGGKSIDYGVVRLDGSGQLSMNNCKINGSLGLGFSTSSGAVLKSFENNVIENCNKQPVHLGVISQAGAFNETSTLNNNTDNFISIGSGYLSVDLSIKPTTVPYQLQSWIEINNKICTVNPGVKFLMNTDADISVTNTGCLKMLGTAARPIKIDGYINSTEKGSWRYININTNNDNQMQYVEMTNGGYSDSYGVLRLGTSGKASINNCKINGSKGHGISTSSGAIINSFTNNIVTNCNKSPIWLGHINQTAAFDMSSTLTGNTDDYIGISSGYIDNTDITTNATTVPYYLSSWIEVQKKWTVNNATFYLHTDAELSVRNLGRINATNCKFDRLPDMGYQYRSISLGGSNGSSFTNCTFAHGAKNTEYGMVNIETNAEITFNGCKFENTSEYGVRINNQNAYIKHDGKNTFSSCSKGNIRAYNGSTLSNFP